jgi:hypothetical protein
MSSTNIVMVFDAFSVERVECVERIDNPISDLVTMPVISVFDVPRVFKVPPPLVRQKGQVSELVLDKALSKRELLAGVRALRAPFPENFVFDREEANSR